jgi:hypothetical protein
MDAGQRKPAATCWYHVKKSNARNVIIAGALGAIVSGDVWAVWTGFKASAAPPAVAVALSR